MEQADTTVVALLPVTDQPYQLHGANVSFLAAQLCMASQDHGCTSNQFGLVEVAATFQPAQRLMGVDDSARPFFASD